MPDHTPDDPIGPEPDGDEPTASTGDTPAGSEAPREDESAEAAAGEAEAHEVDDRPAGEAAQDADSADDSIGDDAARATDHADRDEMLGEVSDEALEEPPEAVESTEEPTEPARDAEVSADAAFASSDAAAPPQRPKRPKPEERFTPKAPSGMSHLGRALAKRPNFRQVVVAVLLAAFGFAGAVQVRGDDGDVLEGVRREELGRILLQLDQRADILEDDILELERTRRELRNNADSDAVARQSAEERLERLKVLTGEIPVSGPGITLRITGPVSDGTLLTAVAELRAAGAEAIEIVGEDETSVRVVVDTYFLGADDEDAVLVSGQTVRAPYTILAIGNPDTLAETVRFPTGIEYDVNEDGAEVSVSESENLTIDTLHVPSEREYARPAPNDEE